MPRQLPQPQEELGLSYPDHSLRIRGSPSSHPVPETQHQSQLLFCPVVYFHCSFLEAKQGFMLVEPLATCPDGQNAVEPYVYHDRV